jgi:hypothetical protein
MVYQKVGSPTEAEAAKEHDFAGKISKMTISTDSTETKKITCMKINIKIYVIYVTSSMDKY